MKICCFCRKELDIGGGRVGRDETCPHCRRDIKCCLNCVVYDISSHYCREPQSEEVRDRERSNFCDFFTFRDGKVEDEEVDQVRKAKGEWEKLFKK